MANTRSAAKRARRSLKQRARNLVIDSKTKSAVKKFIVGLTQEKSATDVVKTLYHEAVRQLDRAVSRGVIPKTRASRKISRLSARVKALAG